MNRPAEAHNRRTYSDRRERPTPIFSRYTLAGGRRRSARRNEDRRRHLFVDLYSKRLAIAVLTLLIMSCVDAQMTLMLIQRGIAVESNPIMAFFLRQGVMPFTVSKFVMTALSLVILCLFKNVNIARIGLPVALNIYLLVIGYEFYLFLS